MSLVFEKKLPEGTFQVFNEKPDFNFLKLKQIHSSIILNEKDITHDLCEADGIASNSSIPLAIQTADCLPIIIIGKKGHAAIHAGWKGLHLDILNHENIYNILPYYAFIGPHIQKLDYEVGIDFKHYFNLEEAFLNIQDKLFFDLSYTASSQLNKYFPNIKIEISNLSTFKEKFLHSFRKNKTDKRNWNIYIPKEQ